MTRRADRPEGDRRPAGPPTGGALLATGYLWLMLWLVAYLSVPALLFGWQPVVITSGSMQPSIRAGDVVLAAPVGDGPLEPGTVVTYESPVEDGALITHRVVSRLADGRYRVKGDANAGPDSTPLGIDDVVGTGRLLVPMVGLPIRWAADAPLFLIAWALVTLAALRHRARKQDGAPTSEPTPGPRSPGWLARARPLAGPLRRWVPAPLSLTAVVVAFRGDPAGFATGAVVAVGTLLLDPRGPHIPIGRWAAAWKRRTRRVRRLRPIAYAALTASLVALLSTSGAVFGATTANAANGFTAGTLAPPTGLTGSSTATGGGGSISFLGAAQIENDSDGTDKLTLRIPVPAVAGGVQADDLLLAHVVWRRDSDWVGIGTPAGWTKLADDYAYDLGKSGTPSEGVSAAVYYRVSDGTEPASYDFSGPNEDSAGAIAAYRGPDPTDPIDTWASLARNILKDSSTPGDSDIIAPSVDTTVPNTTLVAFFGIKRGDTPITVPGSTTERWNVSSNGGDNDTTAAGSDEPMPTAGTTGNRVATTTKASPSIGALIALKPGSSDATVTLDWTATTTPGSDGYVLERWNGATLEATISISPATTETYADGPLPVGQTYTYRLRTTRDAWTSTDAVTTVGT